MKQITTLALLFACAGVAIAQSNAGCTTEQHAAFDFWIGEWSVAKKDGSAAGTNTIEKIQDNCVLRENWVSAKGDFTGTSFNFYDGMSKEWRQLWLDNKGGKLDLRGSRSGNQMIMRTAELENKDGKMSYHRISWTANEDGTVRQRWETITAGDDAVIVFDGLYTKQSN